MSSGVGEVLVPGNLRIRIGLEEIELTVIGKTVIHPRITTQIQVAVNALGNRLQIPL